MHRRRASAVAQVLDGSGAEHPARSGQRGPERCRKGSPPHQPPQDLLARSRAHQGRSPALLRGGGPRAAAAHPRSRDGDEALPARRRRRLLLHEAGAVAASRLDPDLLDPSRFGQRDRLSHDPGHGGVTVGHQSRVHRPEPVVRALRRCRPARLPAFRSRSRRRRVLVDYNRNAWGRTLASIYSPRPRPEATVSMPVTWKEIERGIRIEDFTMLNVPARVAKLGDLWKPLLEKQGRFNLAEIMGS